MDTIGTFLSRGGEHPSRLMGGAGVGAGAGERGGLYYGGCWGPAVGVAKLRTKSRVWENESSNRRSARR